MNYYAFKFKTQAGITLIELIISLAIFFLLVVPMGLMARDAIRSGGYFDEQLTAQKDAQRAVEQLIAQIRTASPSSLGGFPLETTQTDTLTFYANIDQDDLKERLRYFKQGTDFKRGIIKPSINPIVYNPASESVTTLARGITNSPIFTYYDENFTGTQNPLAQPITPASVKFVKANLTIDVRPNQAPGPLTISSQITIRNLKNNL